MDSRESLLTALLSFTRPIPDIGRELSAYGWDAPSPLVVLESLHISSVLNRFIAGELSSVQVDDWANCIELRDDIDYDPSSAVGLALHELADPALTCSLTRQSAAALVATLTYLQPNPSFKRTAPPPLNSSVRHHSMAHLQRAVACLRIAGDDLNPDEITKLLGTVPTHARTKGENISRIAGKTNPAQSGQWRLHATESEPEDLNAQVAELLRKLTNDLAVWHELANRFDIDIFCGWYMAEHNEGVTVSPKTLQALGERGIELALDIYGPDTDA